MMSIEGICKKRLKKINLAANYWIELVNLNQPGVCEPGVTEDFPMEDIKKSLLNGVKLIFPSSLRTLKV